MQGVLAFSFAGQLSTFGATRFDTVGVDHELLCWIVMTVFVVYKIKRVSKLMFNFGWREGKEVSRVSQGTPTQPPYLPSSAGPSLTKPITL